MYIKKHITKRAVNIVFCEGKREQYEMRGFYKNAEQAALKQK